MKMKEYKAKYIRTTKPGKYDKDVYAIKWFEYRGEEYFVEYKPFAYQAMGESPREQHEYEQSRIDRRIEQQEFNQEKTQYRGSCEKALNAFLDYLNDENVNWDEI